MPLNCREVGSECVVRYLEIANPCRNPRGALTCRDRGPEFLLFSHFNECSVEIGNVHARAKVLFGKFSQSSSIATRYVGLCGPRSGCQDQWSEVTLVNILNEPVKSEADTAGKLQIHAPILKTRGWLEAGSAYEFRHRSEVRIKIFRQSLGKIGRVLDFVRVLEPSAKPRSVLRSKVELAQFTSLRQQFKCPGWVLVLD